MPKASSPTFLSLECTLDDAAVREAMCRAFDGYSPNESDDDIEDRESALHSLGVEVQTPFHHRSWSVDEVEGTSEGIFRLSVECRVSADEEFTESFLLIADSVGATDISANTWSIEGDSATRLVVIDGAVVTAVDEIEGEFDEDFELDDE